LVGSKIYVTTKSDTQKFKIKTKLTVDRVAKYATVQQAISVCHRRHHKQTLLASLSVSFKPDDCWSQLQIG